MITSLESTEHTTPNGDIWELSLTEKGTILAQSDKGASEETNPGRTENQFRGDLNRKYREKSAPVEDTEKKSSGDWRKDQRAGHVAHFQRPTEELPGAFIGPEDAFVWLGHPDEGNPWVSKLPDPNNSKNWMSVQPFVDKTKISSHINDVPVEWVAWDESTGCNVYRRLS